MFEVGKVYTIKLIEDGRGPSHYGHCRVKKLNFPLVEVTGMRTGEEWKTGTTILNVASIAFVSAELNKVQKTEAEEAADEKHNPFNQFDK